MWKHIWPVRTVLEDCYGGAMVDVSFENSFSSQLNDEAKNDDILWWNHQNQIFPGPKDDDFNEVASENWEQSKRHRDATRMAILHHWASKNSQQLFSERNILRDSIY